MTSSRKHWPKDIVEKAVQLRNSGKSYSQITKELGVVKSTLSGWLKDLPTSQHIVFTNRKEWLAKIQPMGVRAIKEKRQLEINNIIKKVNSEVEQWNFLNDKQVQNAFLSLLYWAEGQKLPERGSPMKFANTDPRLILLFVKMLKNCYNIDPKKIRVRLYLHWYHKEKEVKNFWKELLNIEDSQFYRVYRKKRSKQKRFRKNSMGICFVVYQSVDLRQEIMHKAYALQKKIVNAPVA